MTKVRIQGGDKSGVVKTLSFMPKVAVNLIWLGPTKDVTSRPWMKVLQLVPYGHHSNGQDECPFLPGAPNVEDPRLCYPPDPQRIKINDPNGKFTTNYFQVAFFIRRYRLKQDDADDAVSPKSLISFGLRYEGQFTGKVIGGPLRHQLDGLYGRNRLFGLVEFESRTRALMPGSVRLSLRPQWIGKMAGSGFDSAGHPLGAHRFGGSVEAAWTPDYFRGWGLLLRGDYGQDYYNLKFVNDLKRISIGFVYDNAEFEAFWRREKRSKTNK